MKNKSNILLLILVILIIVVLIILYGIGSKVDSIEEKLADQGKKITTLYDFIDSEIGLEDQVVEIREQQEQSAILETVSDIRNSQYMTKAKFHPRKNIFAVLVGDGTVHLMDAITKEQQIILRQPDVVFNAFSFLYNGNSMVLGSKCGKLYQADISTGQISYLKDFGDIAIARLDAGKNGNIAIGLAGNHEDSKAQNFGYIYNLTDKKTLSEYSATFSRDYQGIAISPKGDVVAIDEITGKERGSCLLNASTGEEIKLCYHQKYGCGPLSVDVAPDSKTLAIGYAPYHVMVWNTEEGSVKWLFEGHTNWVVSLDFSDDMKFLASGAGDSSARVYDLQIGKEIGRVRFKGPSTYVESVDISSDGKLLLAAVDGFVGIYKMPVK